MAREAEGCSKGQDQRRTGTSVEAIRVRQDPSCNSRLQFCHERSRCRSCASVRNHWRCFTENTKHPEA